MIDEITIDSQTIANELVEDSSYTDLWDKTSIIYIKSGVDTSNLTYLLENFVNQGNANKYGYEMYARIPNDVEIIEA